MVALHAVADLVAEHGRDLAVGGQELVQPARHEDIAAGRGKRVDLGACR